MCYITACLIAVIVISASQDQHEQNFKLLALTLRSDIRAS